jgi:hypothetical protein
LSRHGGTTAGRFHNREREEEKRTIFKHMKLGAKIMVGFGVLIAIAMALGELATVKMKRFVSDSVMLADEYAPEPLLASDLERRVNRTMFAVRRYQIQKVALPSAANLVTLATPGENTRHFRSLSACPPAFPS